MQSVQQQIIKQDKVINLPVYATIKHSIEIDADVEIIVFTSPSNVEAFFEKNKFSLTQKAVAMGEATQKALTKKKVPNSNVQKRKRNTDTDHLRC